MRRFLLLSALCALPLFACSSHPSGAECGPDFSCDSDEATCRKDYPGTFCGQRCNQEGQKDVCPEDTLCGPQFGNELLCSPICESQDDCREGYQCNGLSGSGVKTCQVKAD
jgi:hypothetical protein